MAGGSSTVDGSTLQLKPTPPPRSLSSLSRQDFEYLSHNIAMRSSGSSTARDAAAAQQELVDYMDK